MILKNPKHERFAQELAKGATADEAYQLAGYTEHRGNASRLSSNESIRARLAELLSKGAEAAEVTIESLIREAEAVRVLSMNDHQSSAAISAVVAKAKLAGLWIEKSERTNRYVDPDTIPDAEVIERLRALGGGTASLVAETARHPKITH
jgi:phage terminase small subunit